MNSCTYFNDLLGRLRLKEEDGMIVEIEFADGDDSVEIPEEGTDHAVLDYAYKQIDEYTKGERRTFDFPYSVKGTDFQIKVWKALTEIPYGETRTYKEIAAEIGQPQAVRAVGGANNRNRLPIVIPCHRVIGADGKLVGYAAGVATKEKLLAVERNSMIRNMVV